jgi:putative transcriptional regulator
MENRLKIERAILSLTQDQLANRIGVSRQTINSIEKGRYVPSTVLSLKLSEVFGKPVNDFLRLDDSD